MSLTPYHPTNGTTDFTVAEMAYLIAWGKVNNLEVAIEPVDVDFTCEIAFVGFGEGVAAWTIHRAAGHLWLELLEDRLGQECEGLKMAVRSIDEATARIIADRIEKVKGRCL